MDAESRWQILGSAKPGDLKSWLQKSVPEVKSNQAPEQEGVTKHCTKPTHYQTWEGSCKELHLLSSPQHTFTCAATYSKNYQGYVFPEIWLAE